MNTNVTKNIDILLSNGWDRIAYNVLRGLAKNGLKVVFGADNYLGMGYYSKYASSKFIHHNYKKSEKLFISDILNAINKFKPKVYIPTGEEIFSISRNLEELKRTGVKIPISDIHTLESLNNKVYSFKLAQSTNIPTPETIIPNDLNEIIEFIKENDLPVIIKRGWSRSAQGVFKVENLNISQIQSLIKKNHLEFGKFIVQKFVNGETYGVSVLMNNGETRAVFTHKRLREKIITGGPSTLRISTRNSKLENFAINLLSSVKFHGVAMIEFKFNEKTGDAWFIECNPRFWGSVGLAINAGVNFPYLLYKLAVDGDVEPVTDYKEGLVVEWWLGDKLARLKYLSSSIRNNNYIPSSFKINYFDDYYNDDPIPFFAWIFLLLRRKFIKLR